MANEESIKVVISIIIITIVILLFIIAGIFSFVVARARRLLHEQEKCKLNESHARELFTTRLEIQQYTMQEIGREIHDNVNQKLTLASLYNYQLESELETAPVREKLTRIGDIINESIDELRKLSKNLTHMDEGSVSLHDLVEKDCKRVNALNSCKASYHFSHLDIPLSDSIKNLVHRIAQEFMQNSIKHADCQNIMLQFDYSDAGLCVALRGDGKGFDASGGGTASTGIGLSNMRKRTELLGIEFSLNSGIGLGTEVTLFISADKLNPY